MAKFLVALSVSDDGSTSYEREIEAVFASSAAEKWAAWYCAFTAEYDSPFECSVNEAGGAWKRFEIEIEPIPHYHASEVNT